MTHRLKLGTRKSMLAMAQSRAVARRLMQSHPALEIELVGIETRGDRTLDTPLSKMEGKDFFVAELDNALLDGAVDFTVHSMKDLSLERPLGLTIGAIPARENPRDVVLFAPDIISRLRSGAPIRVGTSSPRRIENVPPFLQKALPQYGQTPHFITEEIRGNVNTRIGYLSLPDDDPKKIDAVVLAFAGLLRLWNSIDGRRELEVLLAGTRWMILPLKECPAAPGQGALAVECRANDQATLDFLASVHCEDTEAAVRQERQVLAEAGGGCHQRFGATLEQHDNLGSLLFVRGCTPDGTNISEIRWQQGPEYQDLHGESLAGPYWDGSRWREAAFTSRDIANLPVPQLLSTALSGGRQAIFVAHSRALPAHWSDTLKGMDHRIWTSGVRSWLRLAEQGIWVEGCAEEFGFDALRPTLQKSLLQLPDIADWTVLTHAGAENTWPCRDVIATYRVIPSDSLDEQHDAVLALRQARSIFWTSGSQYDAFREWVPDNCHHACRYGKTYNYLRTQLDTKTISGLTAFPDVSQWRALTAKNQSQS